MKLNIKKLQTAWSPIQSKKQGGKLIPKGQFGLKTNYVEPFHNSPYNFLNSDKPMSSNIENSINDSNLLNQMIDRFEGFKETPYRNKKDSNDRLTIGHGLTDPKYVKLGKITKEDSLKAVQEHINKEVLPHLTSKPYWNNLNTKQRTALVDYVYNIGSGNFNTKSPSLQKALSESNWKEAAKQMDFDYNDVNNPGAKTRRDFEQGLFLQDYDKIKLNQLPTFRGYLK